MQKIFVYIQERNGAISRHVCAGWHEALQATIRHSDRVVAVVREEASCASKKLF